MRFHLDEHVSHAIAEGLTLRGIDVTTTVSAGLLAASDERQIEFGKAQGRVIFTNDADFIRFGRRTSKHSGIVYAAQNTRSIGEIVGFLCLLNDCVTPEADDWHC